MSKHLLLLSYVICCVSGAALKEKWWYTDGAIETCTGYRKLALTFDDGPRYDYENILNILKQNNVKATFFVLGELLDGNFELTKRAAREGHTISSHSYSHPSLTDLGDDGIRQELRSTAEIIEQATGVWPKYMRPPFGDFDDNVVRIANELRQEVVMWNIDTLDWSDSSNAFNIIQQELGNEDSAIILMHDWTGMSEILQDIIDLGRERSFEFVNMDGCLGNAVTQPPTNWNDGTTPPTNWNDPNYFWNTDDDQEKEIQTTTLSNNNNNNNDKNYDYDPRNYDWYDEWKNWHKLGKNTNGVFFQE